MLQLIGLKSILSNIVMAFQLRSNKRKAEKRSVPLGVIEEAEPQFILNETKIEESAGQRAIGSNIQTIPL